MHEFLYKRNIWRRRISLLLIICMVSSFLQGNVRIASASDTPENATYTATISGSTLCGQTIV